MLVESLSKELLSPIKLFLCPTNFCNENCCCFSTFFVLSPSYRWDYLRVTDDSSNTIGTYCGNQTSKSVRVVGTVALLTFHTDGSVQSRGFELSFSFFPISPGEFNTHLSSAFFALMYSCYSTQSAVTGFVSIANS